MVDDHIAGCFCDSRRRRSAAAALGRSAARVVSRGPRHGRTNFRARDLVESSHAQHPPGVSHVVPDALRHGRGDRLAGPRHRGQRGDFLPLQPVPAAPAAGRRADRAREPGESRAEARIAVVQQRRRLRRRVQLPDVPRPRTETDRVHGTRRAPHLRRQPGIPRTDGQGRRHARLGQLFSRARPATGSGSAHRRQRRSGARAVERRGVEPRLLAPAFRRESGGRRGDARRERSADDDRRHRAGRVRRHDARHAAARLRADHDARPDAARVQRLQPAPDLLGVSLRAAQARRDDRAGAHVDESALPRHHQRR